MGKVLVTGGAGFIGSHVVEALLGAGHQVVVLDNLSHGSAGRIPDGVRLYEADIRDRERVLEIFGSELPDYVSHHAALISVREALERPQEYAEVNIVGSLNLLDAARRYGVIKFIYASSGGAAYGEGRGMPPFTEDTPAAPLDPYGASKVAFEYYLKIYYHNYGLPFTCLRYANVYGPRQDPNGEGGVVAIFSQRMAIGVPCAINGDGSKTRDFVYAADVAQANLLALQGGVGVYNIGTGVPTSILGLFRALRDVSPGYQIEPLMGPNKPGEVFVSCLAAARAADGLRWRPTTSLVDGLAQTAAYFRSQAVPASE
jgi:UDP-glucose 4-epimerase